MVAPTTLATLLSLCAALAAGATIEPKTGLSFPEKKSGGSLLSLGVRYKGPIKVYAVGEYDTGAFLLKMSYGVGAAKMSSALADALKPRCSDAKLIKDFEECLLKGLPNGAPKGTTLMFSPSGGKLGVAINDKQVGSVGNAALCKAFRSIYTDKNAVCTMRKIGEATSSSGSCITPTQGALLGAGVGYAVTKMLS